MITNFLLCNRYCVYLLMKQILVRFWPILVMQFTKSIFLLTARGVQLDNGVTPPPVVYLPTQSSCWYASFSHNGHCLAHPKNFFSDPILRNMFSHMENMGIKNTLQNTHVVDETHHDLRTCAFDRYVRYTSRLFLHHMSASHGPCQKSRVKITSTWDVK